MICSALKPFMPHYFAPERLCESLEFYEEMGERPGVVRKISLVALRIINL